ncbi:MAG TPA: HD-GYP domain-containing protein [Firmicutes bacterium]|jgi:HD-GYP domain-containing protein (c-di-GMP phosphodiesterase class II)|nr:HD-GYP domain-containing protein [Bacillota bacterium]
MQRISLKEIKPGMVLARPVLGATDGRILLPANFKLTPFYIEKISHYKCCEIYIQDSETVEKGKGFNEPILAKTRVKAYTVLHETFEQIQLEEEMAPDKIHEVVNEIVANILDNSHTLYNMFSLEMHDDYTFSHSVNVCVISTLIGSAMGYNQNELELIATGALLHDIGKVRINPEILNKPAKLTASEYAEMQNHPLYGAELIQKTESMGFLTASLALQHHEREDGSGYPYGLKSTGIHPFSKIVTVADVFDAMTAERVYKKASPPHIALKELRSHADQKYSRRVVECLMKVVVPFPIGTDIAL